MSSTKSTKLFEKILVCVDGSKHSEKALSQATQLAVKFGSNVYLLHVMDKRLADFWTETDFMIEPGAPQIHLVDGSESKQRIDAMMEKYLQKTKEKIGKTPRSASKTKSVDINYDIVVGDPAAEVLEYAKRKRIDLIVLGSRGLGRFQKLLLGSVSSKVSQYAKCPVLIVK